MTQIPSPHCCAIYTRKSSEEGLEQEFNSLHAQREAAMAFIDSQRHEGWIPMDDHYDDGGFSGGTLERPALQRLLTDIRDQRIHTVMVYKIDRLTRSLADFARLVELFDQHQVTFVAVTQQFNTTTSMGRLTLNILLSFAQFERELTSERIRDKFALSRQKGKWMGGVPPLGYQVQDRKLVIHEQEAELIRLAFSLFIETGSALHSCQRLNELGHTTRRTQTRTGQLRGGRPFTTSYLYKLLHNRVYLGEVKHKDKWYPGEHQELLHKAIWQQAHDTFQQGTAQRRREQDEKHQTAPLKGLLFDPDGFALVASHTRKKGKVHRYYVSNQALKLGYEQAPFPPSQQNY